MKPDEKLVVKELATALQVSCRYVYEMRRCGFAMAGPARDNQTATCQNAVEWIRENDFRIINGYGAIAKSAKRDS